MDKLKSIIYLREILRQMEKDLGLDFLTLTERNIFLTAYSFAITSWYSPLRRRSITGRHVPCKNTAFLKRPGTQRRNYTFFGVT